jgi:hypothetical protein
VREVAEAWQSRTTIRGRRPTPSISVLLVLHHRKIAKAQVDKADAQGFNADATGFIARLNRSKKKVRFEISPRTQGAPVQVLVQVPAHLWNPLFFVDRNALSGIPG